ncbi:hypothetical protein K7711_15455 [Nocardia sp. CA2R105]|uniref:hypothetical protein n=1 Tax=Nocardia coffeae TaxID=2873381 RepID=UPI001CA7918C|nr:hypothetical protein [Nocardia coffeae]MBY8857883.1 hypothetical protein [Nocardia coffeae]
MQYFTMGTWVLVLALGVAWAGTLVGLICIRQSRLSVTAKFRLVWLTAAAVCIGAIGSQVAMSVAMLGVGLSSGVVRYDVMQRIIALVVAPVGILAGLIIAGDDRKPVRLALGALVAGLCLALMNYLGLSSLAVQGSTTISPSIIAGCSVLLLALAAGLLWATRMRVTTALVGVSVVYAGVIIAIHYLGLSGLSVHIDPAMSQPAGRDLFTMFIPIFVVATMSLAIPITAVLVAPDRTGRLQPEARTKRVPKDPRKRRIAGPNRTADTARKTEPVG